MKVLFKLSYKPYGLKNQEIVEKNFFLFPTENVGEVWDNISKSSQRNPYHF
jgi:hypothetical protein